MAPSDPLLPGLLPPDPRPAPDDEFWLDKRIEVSHLFSPNAPVRMQDMFAGRAPQLQKMVDSVFQDGQHVVVYGDRGVGKTSLLNTMQQRIFHKSKLLDIFFIQCFSGDDFVKIWERIFKDHVWEDGQYPFDDIDDALDPASLFDVIARFRPNRRPLFIFDEFDRVDDAETKLKMAETIKLLSDRSANCTIVISGISKTVRELLLEHESVKRAIRQIEMPRMNPDEICALVGQRLKLAGMTIDDEALEGIVWLCRGMPGYAHLLGMYSAKTAIEGHTLDIKAQHLINSISVCLDEVGESTRQSYAKAVHSVRVNTLSETLLACATANSDEFGAFSAASLRASFREFVGRERDIPDYSRHLQAFCKEERGEILEKWGSPKSFKYRFIDPMMQSYIIMRGIAEGKIALTSGG